MWKHCLEKSLITHDEDEGSQKFLMNNPHRVTQEIEGNAKTIIHTVDEAGQMGTETIERI